MYANVTHFEEHQTWPRHLYVYVVTYDSFWRGLTYCAVGSGEGCDRTSAASGLLDAVLRVVERVVVGQRHSGNAGACA